LSSSKDTSSLSTPPVKGKLLGKAATTAKKNHNKADDVFEFSFDNEQNIKVEDIASRFCLFSYAYGWKN
jgi:hypothetical protein